MQKFGVNLLCRFFWETPNVKIAGMSSWSSGTSNNLTMMKRPQMGSLCCTSAAGAVSVGAITVLVAIAACTSQAHDRPGRIAGG